MRYHVIDLAYAELDDLRDPAFMAREHSMVEILPCVTQRPDWDAEEAARTYAEQEYPNRESPDAFDVIVWPDGHVERARRVTVTVSMVPKFESEWSVTFDVTTGTEGTDNLRRTGTDA